MTVKTEIVNSNTRVTFRQALSLPQGAARVQDGNGSDLVLESYASPDPMSMTLDTFRHTIMAPGGFA